MESGARLDQLLAFFRALSDSSRLKIVALLAQEPLSVEQLSEMLGIGSSTVSHHLATLAKLGLVSARAEGYYSVYALDLEALRRMSQRLLADDTLPALAADVDVGAYDRKVLSNYLTPEGRLKSFPGQRKKQEAILRHIVQAFEPGRRYPEKQVNEILARFNDDTASLRRDLVGLGLMRRQGGGGDYWRVDGETGS